MVHRARAMSDLSGIGRGDGRALWLSTIAFTVCFAVWTIFSIIGVQIKDDLGLSGRSSNYSLALRYLRAAHPAISGRLDGSVRWPDRLHRSHVVRGGRHVAADLRL